MKTGIGYHNPASYTNVVGCWDLSAISTADFETVSYSTPSVWWHFPGSNGSTVSDLGSLGITGTVVNGPVTVNADGADLNGSTQYYAATYTGGLSTTKMSIACVCKADSLSSNEVESPTRKMPLALGIGDTNTAAFRGVFFNIVRTSSAPDKGRVQFQAEGGGADHTCASDDDLFVLNTKTCLVGSYDQTTGLMRLLYADETGKVRYYLAGNTTVIARDATSPQLEMGRHRQSNFLNRYWDGTVQDGLVFDGVALGWKEMMSLAITLLGRQFNLPHFIDRGGNNRHLYVWAPTQFATPILTQIAPGHTGCAFDGATILWYPDPQSFRITGDVSFGCIYAPGDLQNTDRSITAGDLVGCHGRTTNTSTDNYQWGVQVQNDVQSLRWIHESGAGTDRTLADAAIATPRDGIYTIWCSRTSAAVRLWVNNVLSPSSPSAALTAADGGAVSTLTVGGFSTTTPFGYIKGAISSVIVLSTGGTTQAATAYGETVGAAFTRIVS